MTYPNKKALKIPLNKLYYKKIKSEKLKLKQ